MRLAWCLLLVAGTAPDPEPDRSPGDLALSPDGRWALTANRGSASVSLVDLTEGKVVSEVAVGRHPYGIDWRGSVAAVANFHDDTITLLEVAPPKLLTTATISVGNEPRGIALSETQAFVVASGDDAVYVIDLAAKRTTMRVSVGTEPWFAALSPRGILLVGNAGSGDVSRLDTRTWDPIQPVPLGGRNLRRIAIDAKGEAAYVAHIADRGASVTQQNIERGLVLDNRVSRVEIAGGPRTSMGLDMRGFGAGDPEGVAVSPDGTRLAVTLGGTRDILLLSLP